MAGMREFAFKHALTRDVAYATPPAPRAARASPARRRVGPGGGAGPERSRPPSSPRTTTARRSRTARTIPPSRGARSSSLLRRERRRLRPRGLRGRAHPARATRSSSRSTIRDRALVELALARLDMTEGALRPASSSASTPPRPGSARTMPSCARTRSACARGSAGSPAAGTRRSPPRTEAVAALDGLPESPQLARALARLSQIEMLKQQPQSIETRAAGDRSRAARRRLLRRGERPHQPLHRSARPRAWRPTPTRCSSIVDCGRRGRRIRGGVPGDRELHLVDDGLPARRARRAGRRRGARTARGRSGSADRSAPTSTSRS